MKKIMIADKSLRKSADKPDYVLSFKEKLEMAKLLDKLRVDVIELPKIVSEKSDSLIIKTIATTVKNATVSCVVGDTVDSVNKTYEAVSAAVKPRLQVVLPTSAANMEFECGMKPKMMISHIEEIVSACAKLCKEVEFTAVDATRSERAFLIEALNTAIKAGANIITLSDTAGVMVPDEFKTYINDIRDSVENGENIRWSVECSDALNMAVANLFIATSIGVEQIKTTITGIDSPALENVVYTINQKGSYYDIACDVKTVKLQRNIQQIAWNNEEKVNVFANAFEEKEETTVLNEDTTITEVNRIITDLGYDLSEEDCTNVYEEFKRVVAKKTVGEKELEFIIAATTLQVEPTYKLNDFVINSGSIINPTANVTLKKNDKILRGLSTGDGPIEAAFLAIENIIGHHYELDDFQIQSVTRGSEAMGAALVKLRYDGKIYSGNGISTDIIGASIRAYVNALNKIVNEGE